MKLAGPDRCETDAGDLFHFSPDPSIDRFVPHVPATNPGQQPAVWAIDAEHSPLYWFPRDCPRVTAWPRNETERERFREAFCTVAARVHVIELGWMPILASTVLYRYRFDPSLVPSVGGGLRTMGQPRGGRATRRRAIRRSHRLSRVSRHRAASCSEPVAAARSRGLRSVGLQHRAPPEGSAESVKRVSVVGNSGSGKSRLAQRIARVLDVPYVELDAHPPPA